MELEAEAEAEAKEEKQMCKSVHWALDETEEEAPRKRALEPSRVVCLGVQ